MSRQRRWQDNRCSKVLAIQFSGQDLGEQVLQLQPLATIVACLLGAECQQAQQEAWAHLLVEAPAAEVPVADPQVELAMVLLVAAAGRPVEAAAVLLARHAMADYGLGSTGAAARRAAAKELGSGRAAAGEDCATVFATQALASEVAVALSHMMLCRRSSSSHQLQVGLRRHRWMPCI